ncbi:MAG TPA: hypothetical protein VJ302_16730 [Blastocatellia bacterium]|nr:hypothetical protein [Blastocatellia bacterium]
MKLIEATTLTSSSSMAKTKDHICDRRCYDPKVKAKKDKCICICGGVNHGVGLEAAIANIRNFQQSNWAEAKETELAEKLWNRRVFADVGVAFFPSYDSGPSDRELEEEIRKDAELIARTEFKQREKLKGARIQYHSPIGPGLPLKHIYTELRYRGEMLTRIIDEVLQECRQKFCLSPTDLKIDPNSGVVEMMVGEPMWRYLADLLDGYYQRERLRRFEIQLKERNINLK